MLVFMGLRSGILLGGILLVTVTGPLFGMYLHGLDMQRFLLGALIIALGMLVDNRRCCGAVQCGAFGLLSAVDT